MSGDRNGLRRLAAALAVCLTAFALLLQTVAPAQGQTRPAAATPSLHSAGNTSGGSSAVTQTIGWSVEERPLLVHRYGDGPSRRMIVAGIHGGYEWNTSELAERLLGFLNRHPGVVPDDVTLYILPLLNPDGAARSQGYEGRANANGVDLNRNFPHNWQASWPSAGCWDFLPISGGRHPFSEPETRALARFVLSEHIEMLISYHSAALGIFAGGRPEHPGSTRLAEAVAEVTDYPFPPLETGCAYTGQLTDWAAANGVSAVDVELSTHYNLDYRENLRVLFTFLYFDR